MVKHSRRASVPKYKSYKRYKKFVREDFRYSCVYCFIHENQHGGHWHFQVDHHKPKSKFSHLETEYSNLVYGCDHCNNMKSDSWPSDDPLVDGLGWLDPCDHDFHDHYKYDYNTKNEFTIIAITPVGKWMVLTLGLDQLPRIITRQKLEEEQQLDREIIETLRQRVQQLESHPRPNTSVLAELTKYRQLLERAENQLISRFAPVPFTSLKRQKY